MTTYTLSGFVLSYDSNDTLTAVAEATAQITSMDEHNSAFSYSIAMSPSGEVPYVYLGLTEIAQFYVEDYGNLSRYPGTFADYRLGQISGGGFSGVTLSIDNVNIQKSYVFSLGGDQIGPFNSTSDVLNFNKQINSAGTATGALTPGAAIPLEDLRAAVVEAAGRVVLEASGGVNLETVREIAETGVDIISVGALTHSAPNFDFGLDAV